MIDLERLKVSLTKNGYLKLAELVKRHSRWDILEHCEGTHSDINIKRSQVERIMSVSADTGEAPEMWDEIREYGDAAIDCFTLVAVIFSHHRLIELFRDSSQGPYVGHFRRDDFGQEKEFTNLVYSLACLQLCRYTKGAMGVNYDLRSLVHALRRCGSIVRQLIELKLRRCGWVSPANNRMSADGDFETESARLGLHSVFGMEPDEFQSWMRGEEPPMDGTPSAIVQYPNLPR